MTASRAALVMLVLATGCGPRHLYSHGVTAPVAATDQSSAVLVEVIDARDGGHAVPSPIPASERELAEVRVAVDDHVRALGLVAPTPTMSAPESEAELERILADATSQGAHEVVFVRYHMGRLYLGGAVAIFEIVAIDPSTRELLFEHARVTARRSDPSPFDSGIGVLHSALRDAMNDLFRALAESRALGHPGRRALPELSFRILAQPQVRAVGDRVVGIGWSVERAEGWDVTGDLASAAGGERAPDGTYVSVVLEPTHQLSESYAETNAATLRDLANVLMERESTIDGRSALEIETSYPNGQHALQRVLSEDGLGVVASCVAPEAVFEVRRAECQRLLETVRLRPAE